MSNLIEAREVEIRSKLVLQTIYAPHDDVERIKAIPEVERRVLNLFTAKPPSNNVFAVEAPALWGIDIPHFKLWRQSTGRYFEGYLQHSRTGIEKGKPFSRTELANYRAMAEETLTELPRDPHPQEDQSGQLSIYGALLMLDRLSQKVKFSFEIEPFTHKEVVHFFRRGGRLLRQIDGRVAKEDAPLRTREDAEAFIEQLRHEAAEDTRNEVDLLKSRADSYHKFLESLIRKNSKGRRLTRIVLLTNAVNSIFDPDFFRAKQDRDSFTYLDPITFNNSPSIEAEIQRYSVFAKNPNAEVSEEEIVREVMSGLILRGLETIGMSSAGSKSEVLEVANTITGGDLKELFIRAVLSENPYEVTLDYFGEKTGKNYGDVFRFMTFMRRPETREEFHRVFEEAIRDSKGQQSQ